MSSIPMKRIALNSNVGSYLRLSLIRGTMAALDDRPDVELMLQDGMPFSDWETVYREKPDAVITTLLNDDDVERAKQFKGVVVNVAEALPFCGVDSVIVDNRECGVIAGRHLHSTGVGHFGYIGVAGAVNSERRLEGFLSQLPDGGAEAFRLSLDRKDLNEWAKLVRKLRFWIEPLPKPVGLYVYSDVHARAVIQAVRGLGLRVPIDVSVVGTGNYDLDALISRPHLSSVPLNLQKVAYLAARYALKVVEGGRMPEVTKVPPRPIVVRGSSDHFFSEDEAVSKALHYIQNHHLGEVQVDDVAKASGVSRRVLEKRFRAATGSSVYSFVNNVRLRKAKVLLMETDDTVEVVAQKSGFREARLLITALKKASGVTPGEYRRQVAIHA